MSNLVFYCPKCGNKTLSVENIESILDEGVSNSEVVKLVKQLMAEHAEKKYRFWRCKKCKVYYQTDLNGKLIAEFPDTVF